jgi:hypothetical protein
MGQHWQDGSQSLCMTISMRCHLLGASERNVVEILIGRNAMICGDAKGEEIDRDDVAKARVDPDISSFSVASAHVE